MYVYMGHAGASRVLGFPKVGVTPQQPKTAFRSVSTKSNDRNNDGNDV